MQRPCCGRCRPMKTERCCPVAMCADASIDTHHNSNPKTLSELKSQMLTLILAEASFLLDFLHVEFILVTKLSGVRKLRQVAARSKTSTATHAV
eukprot:6473333-Amphidinium_carterae.1